MSQMERSRKSASYAESRCKETNYKKPIRLSSPKKSQWNTLSLKHEEDFPLMCSFHPSEEVRFFCLDCRDGCFCDVCCANNLHIGHHFMVKNDAWTYIKEIELPDYVKALEHFLNDTARVEALILQKRKDSLELPEQAKNLLEKAFFSCFWLMQQSEQQISNDIEMVIELVNQSLEKQISSLNTYIHQFISVEHYLTKLKAIYDPRELCLEYRHCIEKTNFFHDLYQLYIAEFAEFFYSNSESYQPLLNQCAETFYQQLYEIRNLAQLIQSPTFYDTNLPLNLLNADWEALASEIHHIEHENVQVKSSDLPSSIYEMDCALHKQAQTAVERLLRIQVPATSALL